MASPQAGPTSTANAAASAERQQRGAEEHQRQRQHQENDFCPQTREHENPFKDPSSLGQQP